MSASSSEASSVIRDFARCDREPVGRRASQSSASRAQDDPIGVEAADPCLAGRTRLPPGRCSCSIPCDHLPSRSWPL